MSGTLFTPAQAEAGLFSSIFGTTDQVYAETTTIIEKPAEPSHNLQNIALLQANVSSASISEDKDNKDESKGTEGQVNTNIVSDVAFLPTTGAMGVSNGKEITELSPEDMSVYVVRAGDSISQIATMFGVSVNTIRWANDLKTGEKLKEGDVLIILPVSGVMHTVAKGQTLKSIALKYKVEISDITDFNDINENTKLSPGDELIIPDGEMFIDRPVDTSSKNKNTTIKIPTKNLAGYFISPVRSYIKTQGLHGKNAVDLAAPIGTPVYAAASGKVLLARMGWNGAYGNMVVIEHPNGTKTLYSHLYKLDSYTGQNVSQGDVIGYVGNSGRVRAAKGGNGAHLHFEVYGAKNPGVDRSWAD